MFFFLPLSVCLSLCLFIRQQDYSKVIKGLRLNFWSDDGMGVAQGTVD